jgi:macrolide transport system ATP-binding/permease protein
MSVLTKLWNSLSSSKLHAEIQQEIETHLALLEEEARTRGLDGRDAQMDARQRFGNLGKHFENIRDTNLSTGLDDLAHDVRFALRQMGRNRGFTGVALLVIALGIATGLPLDSQSAIWNGCSERIRPEFPGSLCMAAHQPVILLSRHGQSENG